MQSVTSDAVNRFFPKVKKYTQSMSPDSTFDLTIEDNRMYLLFETGSYSQATSNLFMVCTGESSAKAVYPIVDNSGSLQFVDNNVIRFTYLYQGGPDRCFFSLIEIY